MKETFWKNPLNFVKVTPTICASFITIVIIVYGKKIGGITYVLPFVSDAYGVVCI
jgi:hypothetical protein